MTPNKAANGLAIILIVAAMVKFLPTEAWLSLLAVATFVGFAIWTISVWAS